jgi:hypothetical protein
MVQRLVIRKGVIRGQNIVLENDTGLPENQEVLVGIGVVSIGEDETAAQEALAREIEADEALRTIYRMRHTGRSTREL